MVLGRHYTMVAAVFAVAMATGFVMQYSDARASRIDDSVPVGLVPSVAERVTGFRAPVSEAAPGVVVTSADPAPVRALPAPLPVAETGAPVPRVSTRPAPLPPATVDAEAVDRATLDDRCPVTLTAAVLEGGRVQLDLSAPCHTNAAATLAHGPVRATVTTDSAGALQLTVPAFDVDARFEVALEDGMVATTALTVPSAEAFEHVAVQWRGAADMGLHVLEIGADYGEPGHLHAAATGAVSPGGGVLTRLGSMDAEGADGWRVDIYSTPRLATDLRMSIETEVTAESCAREVRGEALAVRRGQAGDVVPVAVKMPGCGAIGELVVLRGWASKVVPAAG